MKNKLSVLLPIHNRSKYFKLILDFYKQNKTSLKFLITDDSDAEEKKKNKEIVNEYSSFHDIEYYDLPLSMPNPYFDQIRFLLSKTKTPFILPSSDDDFFFPEALEAAVEALQKDEGLSVVHGPVYKITLSEQKIYSENMYRPESILEQDVCKRVAKTFIPTFMYPTINGVMRLKNAIAIFDRIYAEHLYKGHLKHALFAEIFFNFMNSVQGRIKVLDIPYWIRLRIIRNEEEFERLNSHPRGSTWTHRGAMYLCNEFNAPDYSTTLRNLIEVMTDELVKKGVDPRQAFEYADACWIGILHDRICQNYKVVMDREKPVFIEPWLKKTLFSFLKKNIVKKEIFHDLKNEFRDSVKQIKQQMNLS